MSGHLRTVAAPWWCRLVRPAWVVYAYPVISDVGHTERAEILAVTPSLWLARRVALWHVWRIRVGLHRYTVGPSVAWDVAITPVKRGETS